MTKENVQAGAARLAAHFGTEVKIAKAKPAKPVNTNSEKKMKKTMKATAPATKKTTKASKPKTAKTTPTETVSEVMIPEIVKDVPQAQPAVSPFAMAKTGSVSVLDRILAAGARGTQVTEAINMAMAICDNEAAVATFVGAVRNAEELALQKLAFDKTAEEVREQWHAKSFAQFESQLQDWANEGEAVAQEVLTTINMFRENPVDVVASLWRLVTEIVRPTEAVRTYHDLSVLLKKLHEKGLLDKKPVGNQRNAFPNSIQLEFEGHAVAYLRQMERGRVIPMIKAGWPYLKEAEGRVIEWSKDRKQVLADMKNSVNGLTSDQAHEGQEGTIFLQTGPSSAAIVAVKTNAVSDLVFRIVKTIGMLARPSGWMNVQADAQAWPDQDVYKEFHKWWKI